MAATASTTSRRRFRAGLSAFVAGLLFLASTAHAQDAPQRLRINLAERFPGLQRLWSPFEGGGNVSRNSQPSVGLDPLDDLLREPEAQAPAPPGALLSQLPTQRTPIRSSPSSTSPLPPLDPGEAFPPTVVFEDTLDPFGEEAFVVAPQRLTSHRNTFFQKLSLQASYIGNGNHEEDLGFTEIETYLTVAVPFPIVEWPLLITPYYQMRLLAGPLNTDLPPRLHDAYVDFMWVPQIVNRWLLILSVSPGVYTDFQKWNDDAFRITGKALVRYDLFPDELQIIAGVLYLGRDDLMLLPAGGVIWTPTDDLRLELIFPTPKLAARFNVGDGFEDWAYFRAEYGGNTYAITRENGEEDKVTWQDIRLLLGIERKLNGGAGFRIEAGYVLGRKVDFASNRGDFTAEDSWLLRGGVIF